MAVDLRASIFEGLPKIGFGGAPLGNLYEAFSDEQAYETLRAAWVKGCRYFDTSPLYGYSTSERRVGEFLQTKNPSEFVIATKVGRLLVKRDRKYDPKWPETPLDIDFDYDYSYEGVMRSVEDSKERLGLERINVVNVHDVDSYTHINEDMRRERYGELMNKVNGGYNALRELRSQGKVDAFGLGVNEPEVCEMFMRDTDPDGFLLASCYTLVKQLALDSFFPKAVRRRIPIVVGGVFESGILAVGSEVGMYNYNPPEESIRNKVRSIEDVCRKFSVSLPSAAIQFTLGHPAVTSVILGMRSPEEVDANYKHFSAEIPPKFWEVLKDEGLIPPHAPVGRVE